MPGSIASPHLLTRSRGASVTGMRLLHSVAFVVSLSLSACKRSAPPIGRKLPGGRWAQVSRAFNERVQSRFPVGSSEAEMVAELRRERVEGPVSHDTPDVQFRHTASFELQGFPCRRFWDISWNSDAGNISEIKGQYSGICL